MGRILILTNDAKCESIKLLATRMQYQSDLIVDVMEHNEKVSLQIHGDAISTKYRKDILKNLFPGPSLKISSIKLVIMWFEEPFTKSILTFAKHLESRGIKILNGADFLAWDLLQAKKTLDIIPQSYLIEMKTLIALAIEPDELAYFQGLTEINDTVNKNLHYPVLAEVFKNNRGYALYLIETPAALKQFISRQINALPAAIILQRYMQNMQSQKTFTYYQINMINGIPQSALEFQLKWEENPDHLYKKFEDSTLVSAKAFDIKQFEQSQLQKIIKALPYQNSVFAVNVQSDSSKNLFLLNIQSKPNLHYISQLGRTFPTFPGNIQAEARKCADFPDKIVDFSLQPNSVNVRPSLRSAL